MTWAIDTVADFDGEDNCGVGDMACDEEVAVVIVSGWSGQAKFKLKCNDPGDEPFSHDYKYIVDAQCVTGNPKVNILKNWPI